MEKFEVMDDMEDMEDMEDHKVLKITCKVKEKKDKGWMEDIEYMQANNNMNELEFMEDKRTWKT